MISQILIILFAGGSAIVAGFLIGAIGIGGVLLVPMLTYGLGINIHVAISVAMFSYIFSGAMGVFLYGRRGSIDWRTSIWLCAGGIPGAYFGSMTAWETSSLILEGILALVVLLSGLNALFQKNTEQNSKTHTGSLSLLILGVVTGFASAVTGTGGPLVLVPILIWLQMPALTAVGLSQVIQIPIALAATAGNIFYGEVDFILGLGIAVSLVIGVIYGAQLAHRLPKEQFRRFIAFALLLVGLLMMLAVLSSTF